MKLYKLLENKKKRIKHLWKTKEYALFSDKLDLLLKFPQVNKQLLETSDDFKIIQANILIQALLNKTQIEKRAKKYLTLNEEEKKDFDIHQDLVYLTSKEDEKIYVPCLSKALNLIYAREPLKLNEAPYDVIKKDFAASLIDPFDEYGFNIYDSLFSRLLKLGEKDEIAFFYHVDFSNIYVINDQGRLDAKICLFDKYMHHINKNGMVERIKPVIEAYNADDKKAFIDALLTQDLISGRMHHLIYKKERKFKRNQFRLKGKK